jgi:hypothetical protein
LADEGDLLECIGRRRRRGLRPWLAGRGILEKVEPGGAWRWAFPMLIPFWFKIAIIAFGLLFFAGHLLLAILGVRRATTRDNRLVAVGVVVPGIAGLFLAGAALSTTPVLGLVLLAPFLPILVIGRAVYELVLYRFGVRF